MSERKKTDHGTSRGARVTDEVIEQLADEAERGYDVDARRRRGGRPPLGSGPSEVVPVRLDPDLREALEQRAREDATSASDVIRRALRAFLDVA